MISFFACCCRCNLCPDGKRPDYLDLTLAGARNSIRPAYVGACGSHDCGTYLDYWWPPACYDEGTDTWDEACVLAARASIGACLCAALAAQVACTVFAPCESLNGTFRLYPDDDHDIFPEFAESFTADECASFYAGEFEFGDILSPSGTLTTCTIFDTELGFSYSAVDATNEDNWTRDVKFRLGIIVTKSGSAQILITPSTPLFTGAGPILTSKAWLCTDCEATVELADGGGLVLGLYTGTGGADPAPGCFCGTRDDVELTPSISAQLEEPPPFESGTFLCTNCGTYEPQVITFTLRAGCDRSTPPAP